MSFFQNQLQPFYLAGSGAIIGATSITLKSMKTIDGASLTMATDFGTIGYLTLEPGNNTLEESVSFTGLVNNADGTTTLTGIQSHLFGEPYTATTGLTKTHAGSTTVIYSNTSSYYTEFGIKKNDETITGYWNVPDPVNPLNIANREWVLSVVNGGPITVNAVIVTGTAGETVVAGNFVYLKVSDGRWYKTSSAASATTDFIQIGIAQGAGTSGNPITNGILIKGVDTNQSGLVAGTIYYLSTAGAISSSAGSFSRAIGQGVTSTTISFDPYFNTSITGNQEGALAGTSGTPSSTNKYVTDSDSRVTNFQGSDGSDGDVTISSGTTTLSRDMYYNNLTVNGTGILITAGYRVFVRKTLTVDITSGANIQNNGGAGGAGEDTTVGATGGSAGSAASAGSFSTPKAGVAGGNAGNNGNGSAGTVGVAETFCMVAVAGVTGGHGASDTSAHTGGAGGAGGAVSSSSATTPRTVSNMYYLYQFTGETAVQRWHIGPSGGGGGGGGNNGSNGSGGGGGSGAPGGIVFVSCETLTITGIGAIQSNGGVGGKGGDATGNSGVGGGGSGGNGGICIVYYHTKTGTGTITASGGSGGVKGSGGSTTAATNGTDGSAGIVIEITG